MPETTGEVVEVRRRPLPREAVGTAPVRAMPPSQVPGLIPGLPGLPGIPALSIPRFAAGRSTAPAAGWVHVRYTDAVLGGNLSYTRPPAVLVVAEGRSGWFTPKRFSPPTIAVQLPPLELPPIIQVPVPSVQVPAAPQVPPLALPSARVSAITIPSVSLPSVSIAIPTVSIPRTVVSQPEFDGWMQSNLWPLRLSDDWGPLNYVKDRIRVALSYFAARVWDGFVQPQIDQVTSGAQNAINASLADVQSKLNAALATARGNIQSALNAAINDANAKIGSLKDSANAALKTIRDGADQNFEKFRTNVNASLAAIPTGVQNALNSFGTGIAKGVNSAFDANRQQLQQALDSYRLSIQQQVNGGLATVTGYTTQALNSVIPQLWALLGLPQNMVFVPVFFEAGFDGFRWYAPAAGTIVHYAAFGG